MSCCGVKSHRKSRMCRYPMDVATFRATFSSCSAQFVKNKNAENHAYEYPEAAEAISRKHYVDDYLHSADIVE